MTQLPSNNEQREFAYDYSHPQIGTHEHLLTVTEAAKALPAVNGKRHAGVTIWRWCRKGIRGVQLEYIRVGRVIMTSSEALDRFYRALALADPTPNSLNAQIRRPRVSPKHSLRRQQQIDAAKQRLKEAGF